MNKIGKWDLLFLVDLNLGFPLSGSDMFYLGILAFKQKNVAGMVYS